MAGSADQRRSWLVLRQSCLPSTYTSPTGSAHGAGPAHSSGERDAPVPRRRSRPGAARSVRRVAHRRTCRRRRGRWRRLRRPRARTRARRSNVPGASRSRRCGRPGGRSRAASYSARAWARVSQPGMRSAAAKTSSKRSSLPGPRAPAPRLVSCSSGRLLRSRVSRVSICSRGVTHERSPSHTGDDHAGPVGAGAGGGSSASPPSPERVWACPVTSSSRPGNR